MCNAFATFGATIWTRLKTLWPQVQIPYTNLLISECWISNYQLLGVRAWNMQTGRQNQDKETPHSPQFVQKVRYSKGYAWTKKVQLLKWKLPGISKVKKSKKEQGLWNFRSNSTQIFEGVGVLWYLRLLGITPIASLSPSGVTRRACHHSSSEAFTTCNMSPKRKLRPWLGRPLSLLRS